MFLKRSYSPEIMDDFSIQDERIDEALRELSVANKYLGGISTSRDGLKLLLDGNNKDKISILDIGAGASDILQHINKKYHSLNFTSLELNKRTCDFLRKNSVSDIVCADSRNLPVKERHFDIVHASLFLHHFKDEEIKKLLKELFKICREGIIINDLRRSILALIGIKIISVLFSRSEMFKNDGPLSVKRGFVKSDLINILTDLQIKKYHLKRKWAFRWMLVIYPD
jgi:2-polyprenyl-3-methyl-5-hydroxy-6-metoxy-1,4-benzoquinol methylase